MTDGQVKKSAVVPAAVIGFIAGLLVSGGIALGHHLSKCRHYQLQCKVLAERIDQSSAEIERVREELVECQSSAERGLRNVSAIAGAAEQIRRQAEVLRDYYRSVGSVISGIDRGSDPSGKAGE